MVANKGYAVTAGIAILALLVTSTGASTVGGSSGAYLRPGQVLQRWRLRAQTLLARLSFSLVESCRDVFHREESLAGSWSSIIGTY